VGGGTATSHVRLARVAKSPQVETSEQVLALAEHDGRNGEVELVDEAGAEILANRGHAAAQAYVLVARRLVGLG
jgi:hypothetical protein